MKYKIIFTSSVYDEDEIKTHQKNVQKFLRLLEKRNSTFIKSKTISLIVGETCNLMTEIFYSENQTRGVITEKKQ